MKFEILNEVEFTEFANNHEMGSFHQNVAWGELKGFTGWKTHLVGVKNDGKIVAATLILSKMTPIKKNMFYAPRGFLIDYSDKVLLKFFVDNLKKYCKQNKGIFIKFDPYVEYQQRDINGDIVVDGYNNDYVVANLKELGCKHHGFTKKMEDMQPRFIFTLTTKGKSVDDIMEVMDSKTRQILRKNERMGVVVREIDVDELNKFHDIMEDTSSRREFVDRPLSYYKNMYECFKKKDEVMVLLAEFNHDNYINSLNEEINKEKKYLEELKSKFDEENGNKNKFLKKTKNSEEIIARLEKSLSDMIESKKENGNIISLGSILFMKTNDEVLSLVGGSYEKFMKFQSAYSTHFAGVKYAIEHGMKRYNFYGITGDFDEKTNEHYGLYSFKRDFGGQVVELVGEFDIILSKFDFMLYNVAFKLYHKLKK